MNLIIMAYGPLYAGILFMIFGFGVGIITYEVSTYFYE